MRESESDHSSLYELFLLMKQRWKGMLVIFALVITATVLFTFLQTPTFESESRILIRYGREYTYRPIDPLLKGEVQPLVSFNRDEVLNTEIQIFTSAELIQQVISKLGIKTIFPKLRIEGKDPEEVMATAITLFRKRLNVQHIKGSGVLRISFQNSNPDVTVKVVKLLITLFKERHLEVFRDPRMSFLEHQLVTYRKKLEQAKGKLKEFMDRHHIISLKDQQQLLLQQYKDLQTMITKGESELRAFDEKIASLAAMRDSVKQDEILFDEKGSNNDVNTARAELLTLQLKEKELLRKYKKNNRLVKNVQEQIKLVEKFLESQPVSSNESVRTGTNPLYRFVEQALIDAQVRRNAQKAQNDSLKKQLVQLKKDLEEFSSAEPEMNMLLKEVEINEKSYENFASKLEETRILEAMDTQKLVNVVVIEKPVKPIKPIKPRKKINLLVGVILGGALSFAYALFFDLLMNSWKAKRDTRKYVTLS